MNCVEWEDRVALHAGGDLAAGESAEVERHLGECPACQMLWSGLREDLTVLQAAHAEIPGAAHFTAVRSRVMAELERQARPWWRLKRIYAFATTVAAVVVLLAVWPHGGPVPPAPRILASIPPAPAAARPAAAVHHRRQPRTAPAHREPLVVKLQTSDPNIVIYWIAD